jgi:hypothetical protein
LRLIPNDSVLAFFSTTVFGQGKAGLALTTASVQWLVADDEPRRLGYAQLRPDRVSWSATRLQIDGRDVELMGDTDADAAGRALQGCLRLLAVRPGPPECICGAPRHWLVFGPAAAVCPGCARRVDYL